MSSTADESNNKFASLLQVEGLSVVHGNADLIAQAVASQAFIGNLPDASTFPDAVFTASSVHAVQAAVQFCATHQLRVCVRSGGHSWQSTWLQGPGSVILDVGGIDSVACNHNLVSVGPGATDINSQIPDNLFLPTGHCKGTPVGGFILGGGFGLGFPKYGLTSTLVKEVEVVLASGEIKTIQARSESDDETAKAVMQLLRGSYNAFPAVVTKYVLQAFPAPKCVLAPGFMLPLRNWKKALKWMRDIAHRGDDDAVDIETTLVLTHSPPPIVKATGEAHMVVIDLMVWSDRDLEETKALVEKYTKDITDTLVPPEPLVALDCKTMDERFALFYPRKMRYYTEFWLGDERFLEAPDSEFEDLLEPIVDMYSSSQALPPPSHTIVVFMPKSLKEKNGGNNIACGFTPSFGVGSNGIYSDADKDEEYAATMHACHGRLIEKDGVFTHATEGQIRNLAKPIATDPAAAIAAKHVALLDPNGMFTKV